MPRIPDNYFETVIYLYPSEEHARNGHSLGGSGFLVSVPSQVEGCLYIYAVTNRHVIRLADSPVVRLNMHDGTTQIFTFNQNDWTDHPDFDDISVVPIKLDASKHRVKAINSSMFITKEIIAEHHIGPGDEVYMIGRFVAHDGKLLNTPSARFGNISMMPGESVRRTDGILQESFLLEMRSLNGYSGSPAFIHIPPFSLRPKTQALRTEYNTWLLGVDWGHLDIMEEVVDENHNRLKERLFVKRNSGKACIVPAWKLFELLELESFVLQRKESDQQMLNAQKAKLSISSEVIS